MSILTERLTWLRAIAALAILFAPAWAYTVLLMISGQAARAVSHGQPTNNVAGYLGTFMVAVAPAAAVGVGMLVHRLWGARWRALVALSAALATAMGLAYAGLNLVNLGFPRVAATAGTMGP